MKVQQAELTKKISQLKSVVPSRHVIPVIQNILVNDGYLIGSNQEITIKAKLEGTEGEKFLIPPKAFALIASLPPGEMEISADDKHDVTIKSGKIKNKFASQDPEQYSFGLFADGEMKDVSVEANKLKECFRHVLFAVATSESNQMMCAVNLKCKDGYLNFAGLDGHMIAWDKVQYDGEWELLIPKGAVEKILSIDLSGEVRIKYSPMKAIFENDDYIIETRVINGPYFKYEQMFKEFSLHTIVNKALFMNAINRALICSYETEPIIMEFKESGVDIRLKSMNTDYEESVPLEMDIESPIRIGFNPRLLIAALKAFTSESVILNLENAKSPMIIDSDDNNLRAIILPVAIQSTSN